MTKKSTWVTPELFDMGEFGGIPEGLDRGFAVEPHMQSCMVIVPEPSVKCFFQIVSCMIAL